MKYRLIYYPPEPLKLTGMIYASEPENDTPSYLSNALDLHLDAGYATGGHIEENVPGIGWVIYDK